MPKVSVVIPTYNRAHFIGEAIQSVLAQSFADFEVVVVDDGSTDNTKEVISSIKDPRIRYIYQENRGMSAAYNAAIQASIGEYAAFLDSDDTWFKETLEKSVKVLDSHPEVAFSYGQFYFMDENGRIIKLCKPPYKYSYVREGKEEIGGLIFGNYISQTAVVTRRSCLDEVGEFDLTLAVSEDLDLWVRLAKNWSVAYIAEPLSTYRIHTNSLMGSTSICEIERSKSLVLERILNDDALGPLFSHLRPKAYFNLYFHLAGTSRRRRETKKARRYLFLAMRTYPRGLLNIMNLLRWVTRFTTTLLPIPSLNLTHRIKRYLDRKRWQKIAAAPGQKVSEAELPRLD